VQNGKFILNITDGTPCEYSNIFFPFSRLIYSYFCNKVLGPYANDKSLSGFEPIIIIRLRTRVEKIGKKNSKLKFFPVDETCKHYIIRPSFNSSPSIIRIIKSWRMRWVGHVAQMGRRGTLIDYWWESQRERDH
jgi:hypothetical protein